MTVLADGDQAGLVESLWARFQPLASLRLAVLERYAAVQAAGRDDPELRAAAAAAAHTLQGSLGTYNRPAGSELARRYADLLRGGGHRTGLSAVASQLRAIVGP